MSRENHDRAEKTPAAAPAAPGPRQQTAGRGRTGGLLPLLAAALLGAAAGAAATWCAARQAQFSQLARLAYGTARAGAEARQAVLAALRPLLGAAGAGAGLPPIPPAEAEAFLRGYGYRPAELPLAAFALWAAAAAALLAGLLVWAVLAFAQNPLYLELTIEDEGPGFAQKELPHLFERFYRGSRAAGQGAGIGLALARQLIEAQNGVLTAENRPTGGARFSVRLYPR